MPFILDKRKITDIHCDCIVNQMASSLCDECFKESKELFEKAGSKEIREALSDHKNKEIGNVILNPAFNLNAKYVFHVFVPTYNDENQADDELIDSYKNCLQLACLNHVESIVFPLLTYGDKSYSFEKAYNIAKATILDFLKTHDVMTVVLSLPFDEFKVPTQLKDELESNQIGIYNRTRILSRTSLSLNTCGFIAIPQNEKNSLKPSEKTFSEMLFEYIDEKKMTDVDFYNKSNLDRRTFSKMKKADYKPSKETVILSCLGLGLNLDESNTLLNSAGYTLPKNSTYNMIILYCINEHCDVYTANELLLENNQPTLSRLCE